mmetsp:Transcript_17522/g.25930  ORF Transcript_17522/g.25930 Transcript_17522/m.25930 type:complete len:297 (-) Transcript_17522:60-950(-)
MSKKPAWNNFDIGSVSKKKKLKQFAKNEDWEVGFRKLSKVKAEEFDPAKENDKVETFKPEDLKNYRKNGDSRSGVSVSRNPKFCLDILRGRNTEKVVVIVAIPPNYAYDLDKEYRADWAENHDGKEPGPYENPTKYADSQRAMEILLQRVPGGCVYGWIEHNGNTLTLIKNERYSVSTQDFDIENNDRYQEFISNVTEQARKQETSKNMVDFPEVEQATTQSIDVYNELADGGVGITLHKSKLHVPRDNNSSDLQYAVKKLTNEVAEIKDRIRAMEIDDQKQPKKTEIGHNPLYWC